MITLELAAEQEAYLQDEAVARGISLDSYATELLAQYCELLRPKPADEATQTQREQAVERLLRASARPDAARLNLPDGMTLREFIHEGHRH